MLITSQPYGDPLNVISTVIRGLYKVTSDINIWIDDHIEQMKSSDNKTIARTGKVLEGAKYGFGLGYIAPVVIISLGQYLCGFNLGALHTIGTAAILSNPIAMTCAALGAIYYGWNALNEQEKAETVDRLRDELGVGAELVKSIANYVIQKTKELLNSESLHELKDFITQSAQSFGKTLSDVTHSFTDITKDAIAKTIEVVEANAERVKEQTEETFNKVKESSEKLIDSISQTTETIVEKSKSLMGNSNNTQIENDNSNDKIRVNLSEKLKEIKKLFESGLISEEVYLEKQRELLNTDL